MQNKILKLGVLGIGLFLTLSSNAKKPNVIFIAADDMNGYGFNHDYPTVKTPHMDKIKSQSVVFTNSYCASPQCSPSRAAFFSGMYPHKTGNYRNGAVSWMSSILADIEALPEFFKKNGYTTWGRGKITHSPLPKEREEGMFDNRPIYKGGFGPFPRPENRNGGGRFDGLDSFPDNEFPDVLNADAAVEFLAQKHEKPFFLYLGLWRPHSPFTAPKRFFDMYNINEINIPDGFNHDDLFDVPQMGKDLTDAKDFAKKGETTPDMWKKYVMGYCATTSFTDWNIGRVVEALDNSLYAENTIVVIISDNGYHCGEKNHWGKSTLWHQADYVPMMIRTPKGKAATCESPVSLLDIYPTLADYCDLGLPSQQLDGESLVPLLNDPGNNSGRLIFTSWGEHYSAVSGSRFRYIQYPDGSEEFYDIQSDPKEWINLAGCPSFKNEKVKYKSVIPLKWQPSVESSKSGNDE